MTHIFTRSLRHAARWTTILCLVMLALVVAACGDSGSAPASTSSSSSSQAGSSNSNTSSSASTGSTVTVTITEKTGGHDIYSFDPQTVTVKAGGTIKWVNNSDENHLLISTPSGVFTADSMVPRSGSNDNTYQMTFKTAGTYSYTSKLVHRENNQPENADSSAKGTITVTS